MTNTDTPRRGITVDVLRPANGRDATNGGVSGRHTALVIVGIIDDRQRTRQRVEIGGMLTGKVTPETPAVYLHIRHVNGADMYSVVPAEGDGSAPAYVTGRYMFGGNYVAGRGTLMALTGGMYGAIAVHDRAERSFHSMPAVVAGV